MPPCLQASSGAWSRLYPLPSIPTRTSIHILIHLVTQQTLSAFLWAQPWVAHWGHRAEGDKQTLDHHKQVKAVWHRMTWELLFFVSGISWFCGSVCLARTPYLLEMQLGADGW